MTGVYVHVPFCKRKCPYCDFFSAAADESLIDEYTRALCGRIGLYAGRYPRAADTLYFGGGTPSLIGAERLCRIYSAVSEGFGLSQGAEITLEVNPEKKDIDFEALRKCGFNRVSIGLQSSDDNELRLLGRLHNRDDALRCIRAARSAGFDNISLDLMIATPSQTRESLKRSIAFCAENGARHISAYLLKIEEGTPYYRMKDSLGLCGDDEQAEAYIFAAEELESYGYGQYEISNFSIEGYESRHNLIYWRDEEYFGFGPSAHSFIGGRRRYYERSFEGFYNDELIDDGEGGGEEEFIMLGLRLAEGITYERFRRRFGRELPEKYVRRAQALEAAGYTVSDTDGIRLSRRGFLVSNAVLAEILK